MTPVENAQLEVVRAEMNGKLDLLLERTQDLRDSRKDHEGRLRDLEENGSKNAQEAVHDVRKLRTRVGIGTGIVGTLVIVANVLGPIAARAIHTS